MLYCVSSVGVPPPLYKTSGIAADAVVLLYVTPKPLPATRNPVSAVGTSLPAPSGFMLKISGLAHDMKSLLGANLQFGAGQVVNRVPLGGAASTSTAPGAGISDPTGISTVTSISVLAGEICETRYLMSWTGSGMGLVIPRLAYGGVGSCAVDG